MSYRLSQRLPDGTVKHLETHEHPKAAFRAMLILSAYEVLNGRVADFQIEPPTFCKIDEVDLPTWAREVILKGLSVRLRCESCGAEAAFDGEERAVEAGWDFPPRLPVTTCQDCPSIPLMISRGLL